MNGQRGVSLIELLVAVTIGGLLIFGATQVYVDSRNTYEVNERVSRLQEAARYALSIIEPDVRMANYWGLVKGASVISGQALRTEASAGAPTNCGANFARDLTHSIEGSDGSATFACADYRDDAVFSADTLTIRRATTTATAGGARLQICSTRVMGQLVTDSSTCTIAPAGQINDLIVDSYYIAKDSVQQTGLPSLRRIRLVAGPAFESQEIIPGIEDMQIQFGVDPTGTSGVATRYVNPEDVDDGEQVVSVRIWLLVRSELPEVGFEDGRTYEYADREQTNGVTTDLNDAGAATAAYAPADGFRRLLVSRTIQIRNALGT